MCGAAASTDAAHCGHCGSRLATVACPSCFGLVFLGAKFCSHCGAQAGSIEIVAESHQACPRCRVYMNTVVVGGSKLHECAKCAGIWVEAAVLRQICADRERQSALIGLPTTQPAAGENTVEERIRYVPCPMCGKLMNRLNFARCSHVIVDVCGQHGTWFDQDELRRLVEFIRAGGLDKAREREICELEERRQQLRSAQTAGNWDTRSEISGSWRAEADSGDILESGISAAADLLKNWFTR